MKKKAKPAPKLDKRTLEWQKQNPWWGSNHFRTGVALSIHVFLEEKFGKAYVGTPEYWRAVDRAMRKFFPDMRKKTKKITKKK